MKKDVVYSMRISRTVREALKRAAKEDRRSVASLLDKIITDYLKTRGFLKGAEFNDERRRFPRKKIPLPAKSFFKTGPQEVFPGVIHDVSLGGVMVGYAKGSEIRFNSKGKLPDFELCFELPRTEAPLCFECDARHMRDVGNEIQVGVAFRNPKTNDVEKLRDYIK
jgi:hypothetical protein